MSSTSHPRRASVAEASQRAASAQPATLPGQHVLVLQGGGALGAYQVGVYQALHEAGLEPDWVIGTSIGAINAAIIAGNAPSDRLSRLHDFWDQVEQRGLHGALNLFGAAYGNLMTITQGIAAFFKPEPLAWLSPHLPLGVDKAAYYTTRPLLETLSRLVDIDRLNARAPRLTVGAVNVRTGRMRYFDSRDERVALEHVLASGALPPAFPAVRIDGEPYWDGGLYSNTPIEAVLEDRQRRSSVIFAVNVWQTEAAEPNSIWQVLNRQKEIQYASRAEHHIDQQRQIHHLRHVIRELSSRLPEDLAQRPDVRELSEWGCGTTMHVVPLLAPALAHEDHTKDIDFSAAGIRARWLAGCDHMRGVIAAAPWTKPVDPMAGVILH